MKASIILPSTNEFFDRVRDDGYIVNLPGDPNMPIRWSVTKDSELGVMPWPKLNPFINFEGDRTHKSYSK